MGKILITESSTSSDKQTTYTEKEVDYDIVMDASRFWDMRQNWELVEFAYCQSKSINYSNFGDSDGHHTTYGLLGRVFDVIPYVTSSDDLQDYAVMWDSYGKFGLEKGTVKHDEKVYVKFFSDDEWLQKIETKHIIIDLFDETKEE